MTLHNFSSQLRRDLTANPKKAGVLGLMVLVALYFWGPLVLTYMKSGAGKSKSKTNMAALILTDDPAEPSQAGKSSGRTRFRWEKVRQAIHGDPRMRSAMFDATWLDPFGKAAPVAEAEPMADMPAVDPAAALAAATAKLEPADLGISLTGIMIGARSRFATINGESCREGDMISLADKNDKSAQHEFHVLRINRHSVQLEMAGRIFTLEMAQKQLAPGDEFDRGRTKERKQ